MHSAAVLSLHLCGQFLGKPGNLMPEPAPAPELHRLGPRLADCPVYLCVGLRGLVIDSVKGLRRGGRGFRSEDCGPHEFIRDPPLLPHPPPLYGCLIYTPTLPNTHTPLCIPHRELCEELFKCVSLVPRFSHYPYRTLTPVAWGHNLSSLLKWTP